MLGNEGDEGIRVFINFACVVVLVCAARQGGGICGTNMLFPSTLRSHKIVGL